MLWLVELHNFLYMEKLKLLHHRTVSKGPGGPLSSGATKVPFIG